MGPINVKYRIEQQDDGRFIVLLLHWDDRWSVLRTATLKVCKFGSLERALNAAKYEVAAMRGVG